MVGIGDIEEEGQYSTDRTQHPNIQMHLEEINDQRVAVILKKHPHPLDDPLVCVYSSPCP